MAGSAPLTLPGERKLEVSLFGPGFGECVVLHVGGGDWIIIDSCIPVASKVPVALSYLRGLGVDPSSAVKLVVATHWHDDHVRGLAEVLRTCAAAEFVCSEALKTEEFLTLVEAYGAPVLVTSSGVDELKRIIDVLKARRANKSYAAVPIFATADRRIWLRNGSDKSMTCEAYSLSPSDAELLSAKMGLTKLLPKTGAPKRRVPELTPNEAAVAIVVTVGENHILLGSDLEETGASGTGWSAIVASSRRPQGQSAVFKVAHHGSQTADHPPLWTTMLVQNPLAILTPFIRGRHALPTPEMSTKILSRAERSYITRTPRRDRPVKRAGVVERTLREMVRSIAPIEIDPGHIRLRLSVDAGEDQDWSVELHDGATVLTDRGTTV